MCTWRGYNEPPKVDTIVYLLDVYNTSVLKEVDNTC